MKTKVSENSSKDAELKKLTQNQLIQIISTLQQQQRKLIAERSILKKQLLKLSAQNQENNSGDAVSSTPEIVKQAQQTVKKSLELVRDMNEKAQIANNEIIESATKQASEILKDAEIQAQQILNAANMQIGAIPIGVPPITSAPDLLDSDFDDEFLLDETYTVPQAKDFLDNVDDDGSYGYLPKLPFEAQFLEELNKLGLDYEDLDEDLLFDLGALKDEEPAEDLQIKPEDILAPTVMVRIGEEKEWENEDEEDDSSKPLSPDLFSDYDPLEESEEYIKAYQAILDEQVDAFDGNEPDALDSDSAIGIGSDDTDLSDQSDLSDPDATKPDPSIPLEIQNDGAIDDADSSKGQESFFTKGDTEAFEPLDSSISGLLSMTKEERKASKKAAKAAKAARKAAKRSGNPRLEKMKAQEAAKTASSDEIADPDSSKLQETTELSAVSVEATDDQESQNVQDVPQIPTEQSQEEMMSKAREMLKTRTVPEIMQASYENFTNVNRVQESMYSDIDYDMYFDDADSFSNTTDVDSEEKTVD